MKTKPKGELLHHKTEYRQKGDIALYFELVFVDEDGFLWKLHGSSFLFDMKPEGRRDVREPRSPSAGVES